MLFVRLFGDGIIRDKWYLTNKHKQNVSKVLDRRYDAQETIFVPTEFGIF